MNAEAMRISVEGSGVRGAARSVLAFLASRARVCVATASLNQIMAFTGYSESHVLRALRTLRKTKNVEWLEGAEAFSETGARRYHLPKACCAGSYCEKKTCQQASVLSGGYGPESPAASMEWRGVSPVISPVQFQLLPEVREAMLGKLRGQYPRWELARTDLSERYFLAECRARAGIYDEPRYLGPPAEQQSIDWDALEATRQKADLLRKHPEVAKLVNVIVMKRKTA